MPAAKTDLLWLPAAVWVPALTATGLTGVHFHDLRHAGNHMVAAAGASLRELMERMGHSSSRAALIYLHSTDERQRTLADAVASQAQAELAGCAWHVCGTTGADSRVMIAGWPSVTPADLGC